MIECVTVSVLGIFHGKCLGRRKKLVWISILLLGCLAPPWKIDDNRKNSVMFCDAFHTNSNGFSIRHRWSIGSISSSSLVPSTRRQMVSMMGSEMAVDSTVVPLTHATYDVPEGRKVDGEPVVLLHGLLGNKRNFHTLGTRLAAQLKKSRAVHCVDLRNHGDYPQQHWREDMSYRSMAADVAAFLESQNIDRAVIIGHSMGGKVAKALALTHPHLVSGLVVLDIAPVKYTTDDGSSWKAITNILQSLNDLPLQDFTTKRQVDTYLQKHIEDPALRAFCLTNLDSSSPLQWKIPLSTLFQQLESLADFNISGQYTGDTFLIQGGASRFVKHSHMDTISTLFPNYMVTTIRGAGHWVHAEAPDDTLALLQKYLDR